MWRMWVLSGLGLLLLAACSGGSSTTTPASTVVMRFKIEGASMEPTLHDGDQLDVMRYTRPVGRGDLVVFRAPTSPQREFLKRIIGVPGDRIRIDTPSGTLRVNGEEQAEPYTQGRTECNGTLCLVDVPDVGGASVPSPEASPLAVNQGAGQPECETTACYFVMGDNRQNSSDSRGGWMVPRENIIGKTLITYWNAGSPNIGLAPNHTITSADNEPVTGSDGQ